MLKYFVEFLGTFVFLSVILNIAFGEANKTGLVPCTPNFPITDPAPKNIFTKIWLR